MKYSKLKGRSESESRYERDDGDRGLGRLGMVGHSRWRSMNHIQVDWNITRKWRVGGK